MVNRRHGDGTGWRGWFLLIWAGFGAWLIWSRWGAIHWFALPDTDDNMRFAQVRALLDGQGWYDLRQHRIDPPGGISIHWSRIVDLPIAALMLLIRPFAGGREAARWACALAPVLALGPGLFAVMLTARRLVDRWAFILAAGILACAQTTMMMWMPLRIDHHGWQLSTLALAVAGMADPERRRGGVLAGLASALSLAIGLELLPYLAVTGLLIALWWVVDRGQAERLRGYGACLAAGAAVGYLVFGSFDNAAPLCDALTPVYLSTLLLAGGLSVALGSLPLDERRWRMVAALAAGGFIAAAFALVWPQCLGRPEHISPELDRLWFSHIREAKPLYEHGWRTSLLTLALPVIGVVGAGVAWWRARGARQAVPWLLVLLLSTFSALLCFWQTRAGPASQLMGVAGATALGQPLVRWTLGHRWMAMRVFGTVAAFVAVSGAFAGLVVKAVPEHKPAYRAKVDTANRRCPTLPALRPIAALPPARILTFIDLGPRLIAVTRHDAIAAPYHRAASEILEVQHAFRARSPEIAHATMRRHGASLLLICPGFSESTVYASEAPQGFYIQLLRGRIPAWLAPVPLPANSPYRLWRLVG